MPRHDQERTRLMGVKMEINTTQTPKAQKTPACTMYGWLLAAFAIIPLSDGISSGNRVTLSVGVRLLAAGVVLLLLGWRHSRRC